MPDRDPELRERLSRLAPPPRRPGFEAELWERVEAAQRASARRWRLASVALAALAAAALAVAGVLAASRGGGSVVERTVSCTTQVRGGLHEFAISTWAADPRLHAAGVLVATAATPLLAFNTFGNQPLVLDRACAPAKARVPLARARLPRAGVFGPGYLSLNARCLLGGRVLLHLRLRLDGRGKPASATLAVRMERKRRPVAYVAWSPKRVTAYVTRACELR